jgi:hypothetical protein
LSRPLSEIDEVRIFGEPHPIIENVVVAVVNLSDKSI